MKKILTSLVGIVSVVAVANAEPYVGINLMYDNIQLDKSLADGIINPILEISHLYEYIGFQKTEDLFAKNSFGASINAGYLFSDYLGAEAYFQYNLQSSVDVSYDGEKIWESKSNFMSGGLDIMGYLPLNNSHSFNLIGTVGGGYYRFETTTNVSLLMIEQKEHENHLALRIGAGVQYDIDATMSIRALGRYIAWEHDKAYSMDDEYLYDLTPVDGMWEASIGFQYRF